MNRQVVEVGQRFERIGRWRRVWEVETISESPGRVTNVVLRDLSDPANKCTLSPEILLDSSRFLPAGQGRPQPVTRPIRQKARARTQRTAGGPDGTQVVALPRRRLEDSMSIETRSPEGYIVICTHQGEDHRFVARHPGVLLACPHCGYSARSMALLLDYIGAARTWQQIDAPVRRRAGQPRPQETTRHLKPAAGTEPPAPRSGLSFLHPRKPSPV